MKKIILFFIVLNFAFRQDKILENFFKDYIIQVEFL